MKNLPINRGQEPKKAELCPFELLKEVMSEYKSTGNTDIPFSGGAIGYISYDYGNYLHNIENKNNYLDHPLFAFGIYDWAVIYDYAQENRFSYIMKKIPLLKTL